MDYTINYKLNTPDGVKNIAIECATLIDVHNNLYHILRNTFEVQNVVDLTIKKNV